MTQRFVVAVFNPDGLPAESVVLAPGECREVTVTTSHLVSAGQTLKVSVCVFDTADLSKTTLLDGRAITTTKTGPEGIGKPMVFVPATYDYYARADDRPLWQVMREVVQHGLDNPTHGENCACMDQFVWALRPHIHKAMPLDTHIRGERMTSEEMQTWAKARARIWHVLHLITKNL